jgi:hypothetical protein
VANELDERGVIFSIFCGSMRPSGLVASLEALGSIQTAASPVQVGDGPTASITNLYRPSKATRSGVVAVRENSWTISARVLFQSSNVPSGAIRITHPKSSLTLIVSLSSLRGRSIVIGVATGYGRSELVLVRGLLALWL